MQVLTESEVRSALTANSLGKKLTQLDPDTYRSEVTADVRRRTAVIGLTAAALSGGGRTVSDVCWKFRAGQCARLSRLPYHAR
jgi:hypothetical protein